MYWKIFHKTDESDFADIVNIFIDWNEVQVWTFFLNELQTFSLLKWKEYFSNFYKITKFLTVLHDKGFHLPGEIIIYLKWEL